MRPSDFDPELNGDGELILGGPGPNHTNAFRNNVIDISSQAEVIEQLSPLNSDGNLNEGQDEASDDDDDDSIFASDDGATIMPGGDGRQRAFAGLSELPRLQREHATNGYRDGVIAAKATSIQAGFDEGFSLGATFGKVAGQIHGMLNGIAEALPRDTAENREIVALVAAAQQALCVEAIFASEYWNGDGTWKYNVPEENDDDEAAVVFEDVVRAHPVIQQWSKTVEKVMGRWNVKWTIPGREGDEDRVLDEATELEKKVPARNVAPPAGATKNPLDW
ncbi:hypothetical protein BROUX41_002743 [Berkeleyomyces rouxiae]|uniref:uncharacterized protein n=1 Tax=Berkeleyomyces rouxiae TaxID=2035830 RepID=UPI003B7B6086